MKKDIVIQVLLGCLISLLAILYNDIRNDVAVMRTDYNATDNKLDSLIISQVENKKFVAFVDSVQTATIKLSFEKLEQQIKDIGK